MKDMRGLEGFRVDKESRLIIVINNVNVNKVKL